MKRFASGSKLPVYIILLLSVLSMSTSAPINKLAMAQGMAPAVINFWRLGVAALCTLPFVLFSQRGRQDLKLLFTTPKDMLLLLCSGVVLAVHFYVWVMSLGVTSVFGSIVLVSAHPVFTLLGDRIFFKQRFSRGALAGAAVSFLGIVLVGANSLLRHEGNIIGDLLALLGALLFAVYMLFGRALRARYSVNTYTTGVYGVSAIILAVISVASGLSFTNYPPLAFGFVACIIVASTFLGHTIVNWSLGHIPTSTASILLLISPISSGVWSYVFLGDVPSVYLLLGGLVTVLGLVWYMMSQNRALRRATESASL